MKSLNKKLRNNINAYTATMGICAKQVFDGSPLCVMGEYLVRFLQFFLLVLIWKSLSKAGVDLGGMDLKQLLTYSLMASVLHQQLDIVTPATSALWEGSVIGRYTRPIAIRGSFIAETIGRWWIPIFLFYALPLWLLSPLLLINPLPVSAFNGLLAFCSLLLSASLGFALDLLFAAFAMNLKNGCWAAVQVRNSVYALMSGAVIPFALFPWGIGRVFMLLPFGSVASAPLTIYTGMVQNPYSLILLQVIWNILLWVAAVIAYGKSEERMISYGG